ncbi:MAG: hypothetical protein EOO39_49255, partial [Cytophagaceae bacterium]
MNRLYIGVILFLYYFSASGQVNFQQLPRELQLYPRDTNNRAVVTISGTINARGYTKIGVRVFREDSLVNVISQTLVPTDSATAFVFSPVIKAEPAEYAFRVFIYKNSDSTLVASTSRVVCGDVYILDGQSNALALTDLDILYSFNFSDKYLRNVTYPYMGSPTQMSWYSAKQPFGSVGGYGLTLQRLILENFGIPTCVMNGGQGGTNIVALTDRDPINHANPFFYYGNLL